MDEHFKHMMQPRNIAPSASSSNLEPFIASKTFSGAKLGYVFKLGEKGIGYYIDKYAKTAMNLKETIKSKDSRNESSVK